MASYRMIVDYADHAIWLDPSRDASARPYTRTGILAAKQRSGLFRVANVFSGSSGERAGIRSGDVIVAINGRPSNTVSSADLWSASRERVGSILRLRVRQPALHRIRDVTLKLTDII